MYYIGRLPKVLTSRYSTTSYLYFLVKVGEYNMRNVR